MGKRIYSILGQKKSSNNITFLRLRATIEKICQKQENKI